MPSGLRRAVASLDGQRLQRGAHGVRLLHVALAHLADEDSDPRDDRHQAFSLQLREGFADRRAADAQAGRQRGLSEPCARRHQIADDGLAQRRHHHQIVQRVSPARRGAEAVGDGCECVRHREGGPCRSKACSAYAVYTKSGARVNQQVRIDRDGEVLTMTLDNTAAGNEITGGMFDAMLATLRGEQKSPKARVLRIRAEGEVFCLGRERAGKDEKSINAEIDSAHRLEARGDGEPAHLRRRGAGQTPPASAWA